jgi:hypothetical protein
MSSFPSNLHNGLAVLVLTSLISGCGGNDDNDNTIGAISGITVAGTKASVTVKGTSLHTTKFSPAGPMIFNGGRYEPGMGSARTGRDRFGRCAA